MKKRRSRKSLTLIICDQCWHKQDEPKPAYFQIDERDRPLRQCEWCGRVSIYYRNMDAQGQVKA